MWANASSLKEVLLNIHIYYFLDNRILHVNFEKVNGNIEIQQERTSVRKSLEKNIDV